MNKFIEAVKSLGCDHARLHYDLGFGDWYGIQLDIDDEELQNLGIPLPNRKTKSISIDVRFGIKKDGNYIIGYSMFNRGYYKVCAWWNKKDSFNHDDKVFEVIKKALKVLNAATEVKIES